MGCNDPEWTVTFSNCMLYNHCLNVTMTITLRNAHSSNYIGPPDNSLKEILTHGNDGNLIFTESKESSIEG